MVETWIRFLLLHWLRWIDWFLDVLSWYKHIKLVKKKKLVFGCGLV